MVENPKPSPEQRPPFSSQAEAFTYDMQQSMLSTAKLSLKPESFTIRDEGFKDLGTYANQEYIERASGFIGQDVDLSYGYYEQAVNADPTRWDYDENESFWGGGTYRGTLTGITEKGVTLLVKGSILSGGGTMEDLEREAKRREEEKSGYEKSFVFYTREFNKHRWISYVKVLSDPKINLLAV